MDLEEPATYLAVLSGRRAPIEESTMTTKKSRSREPTKRRPMRAESPRIQPKKKGELPPEQAAEQELPETERTRERTRSRE